MPERRAAGCCGTACRSQGSALQLDFRHTDRCYSGKLSRYRTVVCARRKDATAACNSRGVMPCCTIQASRHSCCKANRACLTPSGQVQELCPKWAIVNSRHARRATSGRCAAVICWDKAVTSSSITWFGSFNSGGQVLRCSSVRILGGGVTAFRLLQIIFVTDCTGPSG
jgi:hypothetical protein